jgi:hypothetical protein|tara:strand:+ start:364 stop:492 length:129 start_codon:yes stop_codon:yes gene_type:complete
MYIVKEYLTDNIVAITTDKKDAVAMIQFRSNTKEPVLIIEEK